MTISSSRPPKAAVHSQDAWVRIRPIFCDLYPGKTLREVRAVLGRKHGFVATPKQYKTKIREWGLHKYKPRRGKPKVPAAHSGSGKNRVSTPVLHPQDRTEQQIRLSGSPELSPSVSTQINIAQLLEVLSPPFDLAYTIRQCCLWLSAPLRADKFSEVHAGTRYGWRLRGPGEPRHSPADEMHDFFCASDDALSCGVVPMATAFFEKAIKGLVFNLQDFKLIELIRVLESVWMLGKQYDFEVKGVVNTIFEMFVRSFGKQHPVVSLISVSLRQGRNINWQIALWQTFTEELRSLQSDEPLDLYSPYINATEYTCAKSLVRAGDYDTAIAIYEKMSAAPTTWSWNRRRVDFRLAKLYRIRQDTAKALAKLEEVLDIGPSAQNDHLRDGIQWEAHHHMADMLKALGRSFSAHQHHVAAFQGALAAYGDRDAETIFFYRDILQFLETHGSADEVEALRLQNPTINAFLLFPDDTVEAALLNSKLRPGWSMFLTAFFGSISTDDNGKLLPRLTKDYAIVSEIDRKFYCSDGAQCIPSYSNTGR